MNFYQCEIAGENYIGFITYALRTSDKFSFFIPHLNELSPEEKQFRDEVKERMGIDPAAEAENGTAARIRHKTVSTETADKSFFINVSSSKTILYINYNLNLVQMQYQIFILLQKSAGQKPDG